jgi:flagellar basal-body rod protein FlgC
MNVFGMLEVSGAALGVERFRAQVAAANMANAESTRTEEGGPYIRKPFTPDQVKEHVMPLLEGRV